MKLECIFLVAMIALSVSNVAFGETPMIYTEFTFILKPSLLGGIGVFAACDIPEGMVVSRQDHVSRILRTKDVPQEFIKYCIHINDEECICPERFDRMEISWYLNHSDEPNIAVKEVKPDETNGFKTYKVYATRNIKAGEEILMDYHCLNEPEHLKEDFYKKD